MNRKQFLKTTSIGALVLPFLDMAPSEIWEQSSLAMMPPKDGQEYDVLVVGGSYAGLSAALSLARCLRKVLILNFGKPRNAAATNANNLFGNDGMSPAELRKRVLQQLKKYEDYLNFQEGKVTSVTGEDGHFSLQTADGKSFTARKVVLATGATDTLPAIPGLAEQWGKNVHHCPYCHGFESREGRTALLSEGLEAFSMLASVQHWCPELTVFTNGTGEITEQLKTFLSSQKIALHTEKVTRIVGKKNGALQGIEIEGGKLLPFDHIYIKTQTIHQTQLAESLGCKKDATERIETTDFMETNVPGVYAVGDIAAKSTGQIIWAAYSGMMAAVNINIGLIAAKFKK